MGIARRLAAFALAAFAFAPAAAQPMDIGAFLSAPIGIERPAGVSSIPIDVRGGKLFLEASINGERRGFIFDTGSPTILDSRFAETLELEILGSNTGVDANGASVTMDIAIVDTLTVGETIFRNVPVLIFDFSSLPLGPCLFDGGVIGSEILPGSVWRIDIEAGRLTIAESMTAFRTNAVAIRAQLHDFGYPHAPIVDYSIGEFSDRALFDTGNAEEVALFDDVFNHRETGRAIVAGSLRTGRGSEGVSAGGASAIGDLFRFDLSGLRIDGQSPGDLSGSVRRVPPTLLGAGLLESHIVTLDYPGGRFLLEPRAEPANARAHAGFGVAIENDVATVTQLFVGSAAAAGLRLGDRIVAIDGTSVTITPENDRCAVGQWLMQSFDPASAREITVIRDGHRETIALDGAVSPTATPTPR